MKVKEINEHFLSRAPWVNREKTNDRVLVGDPEKDVHTCLVAWTPGFSAVRAAVERGVDLLLVHEPLLDVDSDMTETPKRSYCEKHGLTVLRNHDAWDIWPGVGIPWAWARLLGFDGTPVAVSDNKCQHRYDIEPVEFETFAKRIAARTAKIGEPMVEVAGDPKKVVSKIGTGTGCACNIFTYMKMGCDCAILTDDGSSYWHHVQWAEDSNWPVIVVNHGTSEEPGMVTMTQYVNDHLDGVTAEHLPQGCRFRRVGV